MQLLTKLLARGCYIAAVQNWRHRNAMSVIALLMCICMCCRITETTSP